MNEISLRDLKKEVDKAIKFLHLKGRDEGDVKVLVGATGEIKSTKLDYLNSKFYINEKL